MMNKPIATLATLKNLESAFAGESMAYAKYRYFAKICRELGDAETAQHFEDTAAQELVHAHGHLELLFPKNSLSVARCLELAIEGETHEFSEMYPEFRNTALAEGQTAAALEMSEQIAESQVHALQFSGLLLKASKRFDALSRIEQRHAQAYTNQLNKLNPGA